MNTKSLPTPPGKSMKVVVIGGTGQHLAVES
jgi:hypothetical protein